VVEEHYWLGRQLSKEGTTRKPFRLSKSSCFLNLREREEGKDEITMDSEEQSVLFGCWYCIELNTRGLYERVIKAKRSNSVSHELFGC
jgi:hypothetical protein